MNALLNLLSRKVSEERGEPLGQTIGYNIRFDSVLPNPNGCIIFCTTGILLRMIQSDPSMNNISHLILDEVHERDINNDFLMILVKDLIQLRKDIKIILMSATINEEAFSRYFDSCPIFKVGFSLLKGRLENKEIEGKKEIEKEKRKSRSDEIRSD